MNAMQDMTPLEKLNEDDTIKIKGALYGGQPLAAVAVSTDLRMQQVAAASEHCEEIQVPTGKNDRVRFLKKWAREQRKRALAGGAWSLLILPVFASAAAAESSLAESITNAVVQPDGTLLVTFDDGTTVLVSEDDYTISADGQFVIEVGALAGVEGLEGVTAAAGPGLLAPLTGLLGVGAAAAAAGDDGSGSSSPTTTGVVIDGYISGATVFRDTNGNGLLDDGEISTTTDAQGNFTLGGDTGIPIVAVGGTDISTGLNFEGTLKAPAGSTVVSPVTTLIQQIVEADESGATSVDDAIAAVNAALDLPGDTDVLNDDPISEGNDALFAAGAKVANIVNVGVAAGADEDAIVEALAQAIIEAEEDDEPLNDGAVIEEVLTDALDGEAPNSDITAVAETLANANDAVDESADEGDIDGIADVQQVVAVEVADQVEDGEVTEAITQEDIEEAAEEAITIVDGVLQFGVGVIDEDTDLSDFGLEINFTEASYEVASGVIFTLTMAQADGLEISGDGTVKLVGPFDPDADVSGITTDVDTSEIVTDPGTGTPATIGGETTGGATEDSADPLAVSGVLTISDDDAGEDVFIVQSGTVGTYGSFSLGTDGAWSYSADNSQTAIQALGEGDSLTDSFTAVSADGTEQIVTITITGTNDAAVIDGVSSGNVTEDDADTLTTAGTLTIADVDDGEAQFVAQTGTPGDNGHGVFTLDAAGNWTYSADNSQTAIQALGEGDSLTDSFTAVSADGTEQIVTITITGTNNAAVIGGVTNSDVTEDDADTLTTAGTLTIADVDDGEAQFVAQTGTPGDNGHGVFTLDAAGNWTYSADNSQTAINDLDEGETLTDSFTAVSADGTEQTVTVTINGTRDFGTPFSEDFSDAVTLSDEAGHGVWHTDRYAPEGFEVVEDFGTVDPNFDGESVLRLTTEAVADQDSFRQTHGRKFDLPDGSSEASIQLYIDPAWEPDDGATTGFRQAGFWTTALNAEGNIGAYPIIEFSTLEGVATFRVFTGVSEVLWQEITLPDGIPYGEFIDLKIAVNDDGSVTYTIGSETFTTDSSDPDNTFNVVSLNDVILQGYNQDPENPTAARESYSVYWDNLSADGGFIESDTDLSEVDRITFADIPYDVAPDVELTLTTEQADGLQIGGAGTVKLVGEFDAAADLSGIAVPIDATEVSGFDATITAEEADGLQIDLPADAVLNIDVDYADLSLDNQSLTPEIDLSGITVNGSNAPADLFNVLDAGGAEETFKLLWNYADNAYYDSLPGGTPDINAANIELGNLYAQYLLDGGEPLLDTVQTKVSGTPDFENRQQSLHDNLLGNIKDSVVESRLNSNALNSDNRDDASLQFGDRPIYSGTLTDTDDLLATQVWDVANGYPRSDFAVANGEIYVLNGDAVVDADDSLEGIQAFTDFSDALAAADEGAYLVVGSGTYTENESVYVNGSITIFAEESAVLEGGLRAETGATESVVNVTGLAIDVTGTNYGIYLNGTELTLNVTDVNIDGGGSPTSRGIITQSQTDPTINVSGGSLTNLQSGLYLNPGATLNVDGTVFSGNTAGIGTDDPAALTITNATFDGNGEAIGISGDHDNADVTLSNNTYQTETDQVLVYFARDEPVAIPGELQDVTIVQAVTTDTKADLDVISGTDGADVIVDNPSATDIDLSGGGSDLIILTADNSTEGLNQVIGFTAGAEDGADQLAFNYEGGGQIRGADFEVLFDGDPLGPDTGFATFADVSLTSTSDELIQSGLQDADISAILGAVDPLVDGEDGSILVAVASDEDTLVFSVDLDETAADADRVVSLAVLENTTASDLVADNLYDFSAVSANT